MSVCEVCVCVCREIYIPITFPLQSHYSPWNSWSIFLSYSHYPWVCVCIEKSIFLLHSHYIPIIVHEIRDLYSQYILIIHECVCVSRNRWGDHHWDEDREAQECSVIVCLCVCVCGYRASGDREAEEDSVCLWKYKGVGVCIFGRVCVSECVRQWCVCVWVSVWVCTRKCVRREIACVCIKVWVCIIGRVCVR